MFRIFFFKQQMSGLGKWLHIEVVNNRIYNNSALKKLGSTASFVPDDFEEIRAKRRKHSLSSQAFPYFTDQRVLFFLLVNKNGRPDPFAGCASLAHSVPG